MSFKLSIKKQFIIIFVLVTAVSLVLLSLILRAAIEKCFHDYVWTNQAATHEKIIRYFEDYYEKNKTWQNFDGKEIGAAAEKNGSYFTIFDPHGRLIWTTETSIEPCCSDPNHKYWKNIYPVMYRSSMAARINIGQFTDHIYSPEDIAFRQSIFYGIVLSLSITLLISLSMSLVLSSRLSKPIRQLKEAADAMSHGDLTVHLDKTSSIYEISSLTESINHLSRSLYEQENLRRQLTTNISHELRTPLNIMQNQLEGMIDGVLPIDKERLEGVLREMSRLTGLVGELEKITEAESSSFSPILENVDLSAAIAATASGFEGSFKRKGLELVLNLTPDITIKAPHDKLIQVIMNVISNAYKFTDKGTVTLRSYINDAEHAVFEVTDTGIGIDSEELSKIFERFYRVEKSRSRDTGGAGLGLAIVKKIADACGWKIAAESEKGKFTTFRITF